MKTFLEMQSEETAETLAFLEDSEMYRQDLCNALCGLLQATRGGSDIKKLWYTLRDDDAFVDIMYTNGTSKTVDVSCDSALAMIKDIVKHID